MFQKDRILFGITPTGWTNDDFPELGDNIPFEQTVSEMALAGFQGCSAGHKFPTDPAVLQRALQLRGLRVSEPWTSTYFTATDMKRQTLTNFNEQMNFIQAMGGTVMVVAELGHAVHQLREVSVLPNKPEFTDAQWSAMITGLLELGQLAREHGMTLCYHHHVGTGVQYRHEIDRLMASTDPEWVSLLLDTGHLYFAGDDPLDLVKAYARRIKHVHLKNIRQGVLVESVKLGRSFLDAILAGVFTVPGDSEGVIEFGPILQVLSDHDYEGWLMVEAEQDPAQANPLTHAKMARDYLREVTGL